MVRPIAISIPHSLSRDEARRRIEEGFAGLQRQMTGGLGMVSFHQNWEADRLQFEGGLLGQKISGRLEIQSDSIQIQIDLPELLAALADRVAAALKKETRKLLEKQPKPEP
jgi:hypothetical protein